jgi:hypothetical protein
LRNKKIVARFGSALLAAGLSIAGLALTGNAAQANDGVCGPGDLCLYENTQFGGGQWDANGWVYTYASGHKWWGTDRSINDRASSVKSNYSFWPAVLHEHSNFRGAHISIAPGGQIGWLEHVGMDNMTSSNNY